MAAGLAPRARRPSPWIPRVTATLPRPTSNGPRPDAGLDGFAVGTVSTRIHTVRIVPRFADRSRTLLVPNTGPLVASGRRLFLLPLPGGMLRITGVRG